MRLANKSKSYFLQGRRVYLRSVEIADAYLIKKWHNDPALRKLARADGLPITYTEEKADIKRAIKSKDEIYLMIVKKISNSPIGFIRLNGLASFNRNIWLRMIIGEHSSWGKNYASAALQSVLRWLFYEMNVHRVTLETYATNRRARKFFEKMGFKQEGVLREAHFTGGRYYDIISFGFLKREFNKKSN